MPGIPRTSFLGTNRAAQTRLAAAYARLEQANDRVATQKAYSRPSENTSAAARAALLHDQLDQLDVFGRATDDAKSRLAISDTKLGQAMDLYNRVTELATQGASSLTNPGARLSIREEVLQIRDSLVGISNSTYLGKPLFAGFTDTSAVTFDTLTSTWTFTGTPAEQIIRRIGPNETVRANITAGEVFRDGTTDIFTALDQLATALANNDTPGIQNALTQLPSLRAALSAGQAQLGSAANRADAASDRNAMVRTTLTAELSNVEDVDLADAITDQGRRSAAYQAALGVTAKALNMSLLDWLR